ncbi:MAG: type II toxin-antitoxin system HicB family antitoxin [Acidimicrobiales bacterium]
MKTFTVTARRTGKWWALEVPEVPGVFSQVRRLDQAEAMARDALATMLDVAPDSFGVKVEPALDDAAREVLDALARAKEQLARVQRDATLAAQRAAVVLTRDDGLSMRDAGEVMNLSHQRVAQILEEAERLGNTIGNFGGGDFGGVDVPKGAPNGPHGRHERSVRRPA